MGQDNEQTGRAVNDWTTEPALGRVKVSFTLEITHEDGSVTKHLCEGVMENLNG